MSVVGVSRDRLVRMALVDAMRTTSCSDITLKDLSGEVPNHIEENYGLSGELAEKGLALHLTNLKKVRER
jgi:hypothetical protein